MIFRKLFIFAGLAMTCACQGPGDSAKGKGDQVPEVGYQVMQSTSVPIMTELPGRINALRTAEVRPQISGVIQRQLFREGSIVRQGQPLYQIDSSIYRAAANQASANLASAQANAEAARAKADRFRPLAKEQAIAQQDYTDAAASARQARASVAQNRAALESAQINVRFTRVPAPITGRIGRSLVTEGALATSSQSEPLAVISVLDPIYVDIQQSSADMLRLRQQLARDGAAPLTADVKLKLEDGTTYGLPGSVEFTEVTVDPQTGTVTLRARFPNPQGILLPGMFVRASFAQALLANAFLVPQVALVRDAKGAAQVYVIGKDNKAVLRNVVAEQTFGDKWVVTSGLAAGDKVITQGLGRVKADQAVKPVPESTPQKVSSKGGQSPTPPKAN
jgi:membrane fusion protein (multidrug efflux system)